MWFSKTDWQAHYIPVTNLLTFSYIIKLHFQIQSCSEKKHRITMRNNNIFKKLFPITLIKKKSLSHTPVVETLKTL